MGPRWHLSFLLMLASSCLSCIGCTDSASVTPATPATDSAASIWFRPLPTDSGFDFVHSLGSKRRYWIPETVSGGVALLDYDGDGDLDIYCVQAGGTLAGDRSDAPGNRLFRNDGQFHFTDVTDQAGVGDQGFGMGASCCDIDRDGDIDIFVSNVGQDVLYINRGDGTFEDRTATSGLGDAGFSASAAFRDLDGDRFPELFVSRYLLWSPDKELTCGSGSGEDYCSPNNYQAPAPDLFYKNNADGTFTNISESSGLRAAYGNGLGVVIADFDDDGRQDVYVANDGSPNQMWRNLGDLVFKEMAVTNGCAVNLNGSSEAGMGVQASDLDEDGDLDLFMTHIRNETNTWYRNDRGIFADATLLTGLASSSRDMTGFGMGFQDFDHDGILDLFVANGRVLRVRDSLAGDDPYAEPDQLFRGLGGVRFSEVSPQGGLDSELLYTGRGVAFGDLDDDGDQDIIVINNNGPAILMVNEAQKLGASVTFTVTDKDGAIALGARLEVHCQQRVLHRLVARGYSYCASNDPRVHVGLASADQVDKVIVRWPDGTSSEHGPYQGGSFASIQQSP